MAEIELSPELQAVVARFRTATDQAVTYFTWLQEVINTAMKRMSRMAAAWLHRLGQPGWRIYRKGTPRWTCIMFAPTRREARLAIESEIAVNGGQRDQFAVVRTKGFGPRRRKGRHRR